MDWTVIAQTRIASAINAATLLLVTRMLNKGLDRVEKKIVKREKEQEQEKERK